MAKSNPSNHGSTIKQKTIAPSYGPGNSLYSATESLTAEDIENYFRIIPSRPNSSIDNSISNRNEQKTVQYLRPTSFEHQQKEVQQLNKNKMDIIPYATFHEKLKILFLFKEIKFFLFFFRKQLLPIDQKAYAQDFRKRYDSEFLQVKYFFLINKKIIKIIFLSVGIKVILMVKQQ